MGFDSAIYVILNGNGQEEADDFGVGCVPCVIFIFVCACVGPLFLIHRIRTHIKENIWTPDPDIHSMSCKKKRKRPES